MKFICGTYEAFFSLGGPLRTVKLFTFYHCVQRVDMLLRLFSLVSGTKSLRDERVKSVRDNRQIELIERKCV